MFDVRKKHEEALYQAIRKFGGEETARTIVHGEGGQPERDADWAGNAMQRLEKAFEPDAVKQVRMDCQCGYGMEQKLELVQRLFAEAHDLEEFANCETARNAGLFVEDGVLYLQFWFCPCPLLASVDRLPNKTWCYCTAGYSKALFERVFGCEVDVELLESIKAGDSRCLMSIIPKAPLWQKP